MTVSLVVLLQASLALTVKVRVTVQPLLVSTCVTLVVTELQRSLAVTCAATLASVGGLVGLQPRLPPFGTVSAGEVKSSIVTVWLHVLLLPHGSIAAQVRVAAKVLPHSPLVVVSRMTMRLVPQTSTGALGASKLQAAPHSTVLFVARSEDDTSELQTRHYLVCRLLLPHRSIAAQVRVAAKV